MNYRAVFILIGLIVVLGTVLACIVKPKLHDKVFVYDSNYQVVETFEPKVQVEKIPTQIQNVVKERNDIQVQEQKIVKKEPVRVQEQKVVKAEKPAPIKVVTEQKTENKATEIERQKQEEISWNRWRSNLQNKIMQDSVLPIVPAGTIFRFAFTVDKYGKITNIKTWSETSTYTPYAIMNIAPVIRGLQGQSILNFPSGSTRTITDVNGAWRISNQSRLSKPEDYNDRETVKN